MNDLRPVGIVINVDDRDELDRFFTSKDGHAYQIGFTKYHTEYCRQYRKEHPEYVQKQRESARRYYTKPGNKERKYEYSKEWFKSHRGYKSQKDREYYQRHKEMIKRRNRQFNKIYSHAKCKSGYNAFKMYLRDHRMGWKYMKIPNHYVKRGVGYWTFAHP